jgi:membrane protein required for colicin V production
MPGFCGFPTLAGRAIWPSAIRGSRDPICHVDIESGPDHPMPITLLDIIVLAVMLLSGLLAMIRGFMREILSIAAWAPP